MQRFGDGRDWFFKARYGMFVHWGLYAIPAWHEQHQFRLGLSRGEYTPLSHRWNPVEFDPEVWLDLVEAAGMKYLTFTTKHVDGFCLWNTAKTKFNIMNTPYGKDALALLAEACHRRKIPLCLYYSIADMNHPNYPNSGKSYELPAPEAGDEPDAIKYLDFVRAQVTELCTNYGKIHGFWWDARMFDRPDPSLNALIRQLQPDAVINNRGFDEGDFSTPEREWDQGEHAKNAFVRPTEACTSVGFQSWGYRAGEDFYSDRFLEEKMDGCFAKGGNFLLNVGPDARGVITPEYRARLHRLGAWVRQVGEAFEDAPVAPGLIDDPDVLLTRRGNTLYVHLPKAPASDAVVLRPIDILPKSAILLNTGAPVETRLELLPWNHRDKKPWLRLARLPVNEFASSVLVIRLDFDRLPQRMEAVAKSEIIA